MVITTLNLDMKTMEKICRIASMHGLSKSIVVIKIIKRSLEHTAMMPRYASTVEYQRNELSGHWHCLHVTMSPREYEYITDIRKFFKMSVSLFVALAVEEYYKVYMEKLNDDGIMDNYLYLCHMLVVKTEQNVTTWKIYWGKPESMEGILRKMRKSQ
jgi:hypothetical protein